MAALPFHCTESKAASGFFCLYYTAPPSGEQSNTGKIDVKTVLNHKLPPVPFSRQNPGFVSFVNRTGPADSSAGPVFHRLSACIHTAARLQTKTALTIFCACAGSADSPSAPGLRFGASARLPDVRRLPPPAPPASLCAAAAPPAGFPQRRCTARQAVCAPQAARCPLPGAAVRPPQPSRTRRLRTLPQRPRAYSCAPAPARRPTRRQTGKEPAARYPTPAPARPRAAPPVLLPIPSQIPARPRLPVPSRVPARPRLPAPAQAVSARKPAGLHPFPKRPAAAL